MLIFFTYGKATVETRFECPNRLCPSCGTYGTTIMRGRRTVKKFDGITFGGFRTDWGESCQDCGGYHGLTKREAKRLATESGHLREYRRQTRILELRNFGWLFLIVACIIMLAGVSTLQYKTVYARSADYEQMTAKNSGRIEIERVVFLDCYATENDSSDAITVYYFLGLFEGPGDTTYVASFELESSSVLFARAADYVNDDTQEVGDFSAPVFGSMHGLPNDARGYYTDSVRAWGLGESDGVTTLRRNIRYISASEADSQKANTAVGLTGGALLLAGGGMLGTYLWLYGKRRVKE